MCSRRSPSAILDALEAAYPVLRGTIRDGVTQQRRSFLRFFACQQVCPIAHQMPRCRTKLRPEEEPFLIIGAIAGG